MKREEWGLYSLLVRQNAFLRKSLIILLVLSVLVAGYALEITMLKRDKIVLMDYHGRPQIVTYLDDKVFRSEVEFFTRMIIGKVFNVNYGMLVNTSDWARYIEELRPFYEAGFLEKFIRALKETGFYDTVVRGKLIVQPSTVAIRDVRITDDSGAVVFVTVGLSGISREGGTTYEERFYEIRLQRRDRSIANPWGLYLYYVVELSSSSTIGISKPTEQ